MPLRMRSNVVLPLPFGPRTRSAVPFSSEKLTPENSGASPRRAARSCASSIERLPKDGDANYSRAILSAWPSIAIGPPVDEKRRATASGDDSIDRDFHPGCTWLDGRAAAAKVTRLRHRIACLGDARLDNDRRRARERDAGAHAHAV